MSDWLMSAVIPPLTSPIPIASPNDGRMTIIAMLEKATITLGVTGSPNNTKMNRVNAPALRRAATRKRSRESILAPVSPSTSFDIYLFVIRKIPGEGKNQESGAKMFDENADPDEDQHNSPGDLNGPSKLCCKAGAQHDTGKGKYEAGDADNDGSRGYAG